MMGLFFVIAWPLSKLLDCLLGSEHSTFFRRAELKALVGLHGPDDEYTAGNHDNGPLSIDEVLIIKVRVMVYLWNIRFNVFSLPGKILNALGRFLEGFYPFGLFLAWENFKHIG